MFSNSTSRIARFIVFNILILNGSLHADEPFDYFVNSWSVIGLKDYNDASRVTPDNELLLAGKRVLRLRYGRCLTPLSRKQTKILLDDWLPVVLLAARDGEVQYDFTFWATPLPTVVDWRKAYHWPTEGENFLNWIVVKATNTGSVPEEGKLKVEQTGNKAKLFVWSLNPGQSAEAVIRVPFAPVNDASIFNKEDHQLWLRRTVEYWRDLLATSARIKVPCQKATAALLAAHVCQFITNDHGELHAGEGFYDEFYIRDGAYQIMQFEEAGFWDAAQKAIEYFLSAQRSYSRFETQESQYDANGQALWALWQYYKITGYRNWLEIIYPRMLKSVNWVKRARRRAPADSPFARLLPAAPADGEYLWDGKHHAVGYDFWNLRGIMCTANAATVLGKKDEAEKLQHEVDNYRAAIESAWQRTGLSYFPPSWEKDGTHWGNTETLWPTELFEPDDPRVSALLNEVRKRHGGRFVEGSIRWMGVPNAIHPYMSSYTTMASLVLGEHDKVIEEFYWCLLHSAATHAFPEGIYYKRRFAWSHTIPHALGAANYANMLRHILIHERGDELHLLPAVPDWWLDQGQEICVERAPTHFGTISFWTRGTAEGVEIKIELPYRQKPKKIIFYLPKSRPLISSLKGIEIVKRSDNKKRWDFPTVVKLYHKQASPINLMPSFEKLPLDTALTEKQCQFIDLTPYANMDPFKTSPGDEKYRFNNLPIGEQILGGVPFRIINPAKNRNHSFIMLHSPKAPKESRGPREVVIPIKMRGRRLFFLGNVHRWGVDDKEMGEWITAAEYVIHYVNGTKQTIPLTIGRTIDNWAESPRAREVFNSPSKYGSWHLNILGVTLCPVEIEKIIFRDLGTPAAPVLAAITIEK